MNEANNPATVAFTDAPGVPQVEELLSRQQAHWQRGERILLEQLLADLPTVRADPHALLELVLQEASLRQQGGEQPELAEYLQRFPEHAPALQIQWELERLLASGQSRSRRRGQAADERGAVSLHRIGRYEIQRVLGKGGMGIVLQAWDPNLKRQVAVKILRGSAEASTAEQARFHTEAAAIARVKHANIVQVYDVGSHEGQPYFAMEYCAGGSLAERLNGQPLPARMAATVVEQLAHGIAAAHAVQFIHRDLKPANVLIVEQAASREEGSKHTIAADSAARNEPPSAHSATLGLAGSKSLPGTLYKVSDFGLAKQLDGVDDGQTRTGAVLGTPSYMAPEQAFGAAKQVTPLADVYALGAILYECLTGRPPFRGATVADTLDQVRYREPVPVRQLQPEVSIDLETIALKCLQKEPAKRYASAVALAEDLRRSLDGRPIQARPLGALARSWRWCRRNPVVASLLALVCLVLVGGAGSTTLMWLRAEDNYAESEKQREEAEKNKKKADENAAKAEKRRVVANERLLFAFETVDDYFNVITDERLLNEPGMTELRKELMFKARPFFEKMLSERKDDAVLQAQLAVAVSRLAELETDFGDKEKAVALWDDTLQAFSTIKAPTLKLQQEMRYRLGRAQTKRAECLQDLGRASEAIAAFEQARRELFALGKETNELVYWHAAGDCLRDLAQAYQKQQQWERALETMRQALAEEQALDEQLKGQNKSALGRAHLLLGQALTSVDNPAALRELTAARGIFTTLAAASTTQYDRGFLAFAHGALGNVYAYMDRRQDAEDSVRASQLVWDELVRDFALFGKYRRERAVNAHNFAGWLLKWQREADSQEWAQKALDDREHLHRKYPKVVQYRQDTAVSYQQFASLANARKDLSGAIEWHSKAIEVALPILQVNPRAADTKALIALNAGGRGQKQMAVGQAAASVASWTLAVEHETGARRTFFQSYRAVALAHGGDWRGARKEIEAVVPQKPKPGPTHFNLACASGRSIMMLAKETTLPAAEIQQEQRAFAKLAVEFLQHLQQAGYFNNPKALHDLRIHPDLNPLRQHPDFQRLLPPP